MPRMPRIRRATAADIPAIVAMLADDQLGATRETPGELGPYQAAFDRIDADKNQYLAVAERDGAIIGTLQLTITPGLSRTALTRGVIEGVRIHRGERGEGLGRILMDWAIDQARRQGCGMVQLTSDISRTDAHRFYEQLGFEQSHYGYKLTFS